MSKPSEKKPDNVILVGMMGAGKSTVGRLLARLLGFGFIDTDNKIEMKAGSTVAEIFRAHGEAHFRELEQKALRQVAHARKHVIAAGGGTVEAGEPWHALAETGVVVWINPPLDEIARRVFAAGADADAVQRRPLLKDLIANLDLPRKGNGAAHGLLMQETRTIIKERLGALLGSRLGQYRSADIIVEPEFETPEMTARKIADALREFGISGVKGRGS